MATRSQATSRTLATNRGTVQNFTFSLNFNGISALVSSNTGNIYRSTGYTVAFWTKGPMGIVASTRLYGEGSSTSNNPIFSINVDPTTPTIFPTIFLRNDAATNFYGANGLNGSIPVWDEKWHHICFRDSNGAATLYIDGIADAVNFNYTPSGTFTLNRTAVGALLRAASSNFSKVQITDVRTYTSAFTATQVKALYLQGINATPTNLWWKFNEGSGTTANDSSGNSNTGTITAATWSTDVPSRIRTAASARTLI